MFTLEQKPPYTPQEHITPAPRLELNRLLATAVVDYQFRTRLLNNPEKVMDEEYEGTTFNLAVEERAFLLSIQAQSLQELAQKLLVSLSNHLVPVHHVSYANYS